MDFDAVDQKRDLPRTRVIPVTDGANFLLTQHDPHGFWTVHREKGQIPERLKGEYTTIDKARKAVESYIAWMTKEKSTLKEELKVKDKKVE